MSEAEYSEPTILVDNHLESPSLQEMVDNPEILEQEAERVVELAQQLKNSSTDNINKIKNKGDPKLEKEVMNIFNITLFVYKNLYEKKILSTDMYLNMVKNLILDTENKLNQPYIKEEIVVK